MTDSNEDYEIGYGKPPKHTRFKPGQSGNPKGRPKKTRNFKTDLQEELQAPITITESGQTKVISRQQAVIKRTLEKALQSDLRAAQMLVQWVGNHLMEEPDLLADQPLAAEDLALLERNGLSREVVEGGDHNDE
mgnify:CR=1 FL=1